ncbi:MAG TPA: hypothetical protein VF229_04115, partial [Burkholderiaceae bacterium]
MIETGEAGGEPSFAPEGATEGALAAVPAGAATGLPAAVASKPAEEYDARFDRSMPQPGAIARAILEGFDRHYRLFRYVA